MLSGANGALGTAADPAQATDGGSTGMSVDAQGPPTPSKGEAAPTVVHPRHKDVPAFYEYIRNRQVCLLPAAQGGRPAHVCAQATMSPFVKIWLSLGPCGPTC